MRRIGREIQEWGQERLAVAVIEARGGVDGGISASVASSMSPQVDIKSRHPEGEPGYACAPV
jgi:DNA-binding IclR family transcriptional regulator